MFSFGSGTAVGIDPEKERAPPPLPTPVHFPNPEIPEPRPAKEFQAHLPDLFTQYCMIQKPSDIQIENIASLNFDFRQQVDLEEIVPTGEDGSQYLPPKSWFNTNESSRHQSIAHELFTSQKHTLLSNGHKVPDRETFQSLAREVTCESDDGFRAIGRRKPRPGHPAPKFHSFRKFWTQLDLLSHYWDTSLDHYTAVDGVGIGAAEKPSAPLPPPSAKGLKRLSLSMTPKPPTAEASPSVPKKGYTGRRVSTGSKMPESYRIDTVRGFVEPIVWAFGCQMHNPRRVPHLEIRSLLVPVTQSSILWRTPQDKSLAKKAIVEGPILGLQCRADTAFTGEDSTVAVLDLAREMSGLLLLAQQRAREGKTRVIPGRGKWWTTVPRWGGGPGGEFGEAEGNTDAKPGPPLSGKKANVSHNPTYGPRKRTEEEIWKELKPAAGEWDPRIIYLSVGKDRNVPHDSVFMISSLFHHVCILKMQIHPMYTEFLLTGKGPPAGYPDDSWCSPTLKRSRWYDLLNPSDRGELLRGLWGVMCYVMRPGPPSREQSSRQQSDSSHAFPFRKKQSITATNSKLTPQKSHSVAF